MDEKELEAMFPQLTPPTPLVEYAVGAYLNSSTLHISVFNRTENVFQHQIQVFLPNEYFAPLWAEMIAKYFKTTVIYENSK